MFLALTCISKCQWKLAIRILLEGKIVFKWAAHRIHLVGEVVKDKLFKQYRVSISKEVKQVDCFLKKKIIISFYCKNNIYYFENFQNHQKAERSR